MPIYTARCVLPVASSPLHDAAIRVRNDQIVDVGPADTIVHDAEEEVRDLGQVVLIPGLINAHCHLELSWMGAEPPEGGDYVGWLRRLLELRETEQPEVALDAARHALESLVTRGTVAVGDVANGTWIAPLLARSELHGVLFHEILGLQSRTAESLLDESATRLEQMAADPVIREAGDRMRIVLTPHAPHTTSTGLLRALAGRAAAAGEPLSIHVAESAAERSFLADGGGPLAELYREREFGDGSWKPPGQSSVEYLDRIGLLTERTLAVHCVGLDHQDHTRLQSRRATVVTCPRSNRKLGVGRAPIPQLLKEGVPVAIGTDSLASTPDLDLFAEMTALHEEHPSLSPAAILRMATLNGARALQLDGKLGSIEPGKLARLVVVPLPDGADPLKTICSTPSEVFPLAGAPWEPRG